MKTTTDRAINDRGSPNTRERVSQVALLVLGCGSAVHCSSQGGLEFNSLERSYWYEISLFSTFTYLFLGPLLAARTADARLIAGLPIIGNTVVTSFVVFNVLRALTQTGYVPTDGNAIAAGLSEALYPWCAGAVVSAVMSLVIALTGRLADARARRTRRGSVALVLAAIAAATTAAFIWYLRPAAGNYRPHLETMALIPLAVAVLGLAAALASLPWPKQGHSETASSRRWFLAFAGVSAAATLVLWVAGERLSAFAAGRT